MNTSGPARFRSGTCPLLFNPARGWVASANQPLVDDDSALHIHDDVAYGYRARRIQTLIESADGPIDAAYMRAMQSDSRNAAAEITCPSSSRSTTNPLLSTSPGRCLVPGPSAAPSHHRGHTRWTVRHPGAALFGSFWRHLLAQTFHDDLPEDSYPDGGGRWFRVMEILLDDPTSHWWDDANTDETETRDEILIRALDAAIDELGTNPDRWDWTKMHTARFENASLGQSGIPPLEWILNSGAHSVSRWRLDSQRNLVGCGRGQL